MSNERETPIEFRLLETDSMRETREAWRRLEEAQMREICAHLARAFAALPECEVADEQRRRAGAAGG